MRRPPIAFVLVFVFLAAGLGGAGALYFRHLKAELREAKLAELSAIAAVKAAGVAEWRRERISDAETLLRNPPAVRAIGEWLARPEPRAEAELGRWLEQLRESRPYRGVLLLGPGGEVRLSVPAARMPDPQAVQSALAAGRAGKPISSDFHRAGSDDKVVISLFASVRDPDRPQAAPLGFLVLEIDPQDFLYPFVQRWPTPSPSGEALLVERRGEEVVYLNELRHRKGKALAPGTPLRTKKLPASQAVGGPPPASPRNGGREEEAGLPRLTGTGEGVDYRGEAVLAAWLPVPGTSWAVVAKVDAAETYAPLTHSALLRGAAVGALVIGAAAVLAFLGAGQAARAEREAAEALRASGERFRAIFDKAGVGIVEVAGDDRFIAVNDRIC
ncbi:MAG: hypothetical protein HY900_03055, partial [Deltaproteobacteria bacterium]|nr:hypothetical protein [Deltaproteobacteria bacterium]